MSLWAIASAVGFGAMLIVTAAVQAHRFRVRGWLRARDDFLFIPAWTFFAPRPIVRDVRLLWRERLVGGAISPWHEALGPAGGLGRAVWNPGKRARKAIFDCGDIVARAGGAPGDSLATMGFAYLMLIHYVVGLPASPLGTARQFAVVSTQGADDGDGPFDLRFVSAWHPLPGADGDVSATFSATRERGGQPA